MSLSVVMPFFVNSCHSSTFFILSHSFRFVFFFVSLVYDLFESLLQSNNDNIRHIFKIDKMTLKRQAITEEKNNFGAVALNSYIIFVELPIIGKKN